MYTYVSGFLTTQNVRGVLNVAVHGMLSAQKVQDQSNKLHGGVLVPLCFT